MIHEFSFRPFRSEGLENFGHAAVIGIGSTNDVSGARSPKETRKAVIQRCPTAFDTRITLDIVVNDVWRCDARHSGDLGQPVLHPVYVLYRARVRLGRGRVYTTAGYFMVH